MYIQALFTVTNPAVAHSLATAVGTHTPTGVSAAALGNLACREIHIQPQGDNGNPMYIGDALVSATLYAIRLPAGDTGDPPPPFVIGPYGGDPIKLSEIYVLGTAGEKIHIGLVI